MAEFRQPGQRIGSVTWGAGSRASLVGQGRWFVTHGGVRDEVTERNLADYYDGWDMHPSMHYGQLILPDLARLMGGRWTFNAPRPAEGVVH